MVNGPHGPPGFSGAEGGNGGGDPSHPHEEYLPEPLNSLQREELHRRDMDALHTAIIGETPEARALANLAECTRLENLQRALDERARQRVPDNSRRQRTPSPRGYALSSMRLRRPSAATVNPVSAGFCVILPPSFPPMQALRSVEASVVGEARGGSLVDRRPSRGNRARRISLRPVRPVDWLRRDCIRVRQQ